MNPRELAILLPCHSLEDFPTHCKGAQAEDLLAQWCSLWDPALIAAAGKMPTWHRADTPPDDTAQWLLAIPQASRDLIPDTWLQKVLDQTIGVVRGPLTADQIPCAWSSVAGLRPPSPADDLDRDFRALGYAYLQVELLTRRMRYTSHVERTQLQTRLVEAAQAAMAGDREAARTGLGRCFDLLGEARDHFYPVDVHLVDLTLVADSTLGGDFQAALAEGLPPTSLLISGNTLDRLAKEHPRNLELLRGAMAEGRATVVGGEYEEAEISLESLEELLANLRRGRAAYLMHLGSAPAVFARRKFGLMPLLPQLLRRHGFRGAYHVTLDDGQFPTSERSRFRWEGLDGSTVDALGRLPLDAADPATFLQYFLQLGDAMDHDHVATLALAHWPGRTSAFHEYLHRASRFSPVLGKFTLMDKYLETTDTYYGATRLAADAYHSPYLVQDVAERRGDPVSRHVLHWQEAMRREAYSGVDAAAALLRNRLRARPGDGVPVIARGEDLEQAGKAFAQGLPRGAPPRDPGVLVINPYCFHRKVGLRQREGGAAVRVDVPAMGFTWLPRGQQPVRARTPRSPIAAENVLRNQFLEVVVHPRHGGIQAVRVPGMRGNRASQQIALRKRGAEGAPGEAWRDPDTGAEYSHMVCDELEITESTPVVGTICTRGRLIDGQGRALARFRQCTSLWRGSRVITVEVDLDGVEPPVGDPWTSYLAHRLAWSDAGADVRRSLCGCAVPTDRSRIEACEFIEIASGEQRLVLLPGGLPHHRMAGQRILDTLLIVEGEQARSFRLGIGVDVPNPAQAARDWMVPPIVLADTAGPPSPRPTGWLFHIDARNVVATHWEPLEPAGSAEPTSFLENVGGFRVRLLETQGRSGRTVLRCFRPPSRADHVDFLGNTLSTLPVRDDGIALDYSPYEWIQIDARF